MRLLQLSDVHFGGEDPGAVEAATAFAREAGATLIMVTGDLTLNGLPKEFAAAERWLAELPQPLLVTPGNHDTPYWNLPLRAFTPFRRYRRFIGAPTSSRIDLPGLAARMINTSRGFQPRLDWSKGAIDLDLVEAAVETLPDRALRVVGCHHPLVEVKGAPVTGDVHRGQAAARRLAAAGVDMVLTGHVHMPFAVALPFGDALTYAVGAGTLSVRTRGSPPGFNVFEIEEDGIEVEALGWADGRLSTWRCWTLPRRGADPARAPEARLSNREVLVNESGPGEVARP